MNLNFTKRDIAYLFFLGIVGIILAICITYGQQDASQVVVEVDGQIYGTYSLMENRQVEIKDSNGVCINLLEILDGAVHMLEATCPDRLCVKQKKITKQKETIVCLPHKVIVYLSDAQDSTMDGIAR